MPKNKQQFNSGTPQNKLTSTQARRFFRGISTSILERSGRASGRTIAAAIGVIIVLWLIVARVYIPLRQEAGLPSGVTTSDPKLKDSDIEFLVNQYSERISHVTQSYAQYRGFFTPPAP